MKIKTVAILLAFFISSFVNQAKAESFRVLNSSSTVRQGEVLIVELDKDLKDKNLAILLFDRVYAFNKNGAAFIGIDVGHRPGRYIVSLVDLTDPDDPKRYNQDYSIVEVSARSFNEWYAGKPSGQRSAKREKELALLRSAYMLADIKEDFTSGPFVEPLEEVTITDEFGMIRKYGTYNRKRKSYRIVAKIPHGGVDLRAKIPTPVMAINSGRVLLATEFSKEGKIVIIDHGSGVLSLYLHLSEFLVKKGDLVSVGNTIALSGATPKGVPPHLHLMVKVNEVNVDPLGFINTANKCLEKTGK